MQLKCLAHCSAYRQPDSRLPSFQYEHSCYHARVNSLVLHQHLLAQLMICSKSCERLPLTDANWQDDSVKS